jgi:hypothetical protein
MQLRSICGLFCLRLVFHKLSPHGQKHAKFVILTQEIHQSHKFYHYYPPMISFQKETLIAEICESVGVDHA